MSSQKLPWQICSGPRRPEPRCSAGIPCNAHLYHNSCITNHRLTADNVVAVAQAGRGRWKIENENNNVLKTKGYHLEHNLRCGKVILVVGLCGDVR